VTGDAISTAVVAVRTLIAAAATAFAVNIAATVCTDNFSAGSAALELQFLLNRNPVLKEVQQLLRPSANGITHTKAATTPTIATYITDKIALNGAIAGAASDLKVAKKLSHCVHPAMCKTKHRDKKKDQGPEDTAKVEASPNTCSK